MGEEKMTRAEAVRAADLRARLQRFHAKYVKTADGCWVWQAARQSKGRPSFGIGKTHSSLAYRWAYENVKTKEHQPTKLKKGSTLIQHCQTQLCVNPAHYKPGPHSYNSRKTHCKWGHALSGENLVVRRDGRRRCRECDNRLNRQYYARSYVPKVRDVAAPQSSIDAQKQKLQAALDDEDPLLRSTRD